MSRGAALVAELGLGGLPPEALELRVDEPMRRHTTLRLGGPADVWARPVDEQALALLLAACTRIAAPVLFVGGGSNLLVRDGGIRGVVVNLGRMTRVWRPDPEGAMARAESIGVRIGREGYDEEQVSHGGITLAENFPKMVRPEATSMPFSKVRLNSPLTVFIATRSGLRSRKRLPTRRGGKARRGSFKTLRDSVVRDTGLAGIGLFASRDAQVLGMSTDTHHVHLAWRRDHKDLNKLPFPMISDIKRELTGALGIIDRDGGVAQRATFLVDPNGVIRFVYVTDGSVGRNPQEVLRVLDALQTDELCPCNWKQGEDTLKAA